MPRRRVVQKRPVLPDPKFGDQLITRFVSCMMKHGKKSCAEKQLYGALDIIESKNPSSLVPGVNSALELFKVAVENSKPLVEVKSRRVGGSNYQVPVEVRPERRTALAIRWLVDFSRKRPGKSMMQKLSAEIMDAAQKRGATAKKREDVHKMAEANKAFAHYRW